MKIEKENIEIKTEIPGTVIRQNTDLGDVTGLGKISGEYFSLYERLGGVEGITLIVDDVIEAHMNNPVIKNIFIPYRDQPERLASIRQHTIDFFSAGSGGPVEYKGRDMPTTHEGMGINAEQYICVMDDIMSVLEEHGIDETSKKDALAILWSLKGMIIGK